MNDNETPDYLEKKGREIIEALEQHMSKFADIPSNFLRNSSKDSDWMSLIKWHALLETCLNQLLSAHFKTPELNRIIARLEMSNTKTGKIAFATACGLLTPDMRAFIQKLSEMRNYAVHDIKNFNFTFSSYAESIDTNDRRAWGRVMAFAEGDTHQRDAAIEKSIRDVVHFGFTWILLQVCLHDMSFQQGQPPVLLQNPKSTPKKPRQNSQS